MIEQREITVYLIRHGQTYGNALKRYVGGRTDEPLTQEGEELLEKRKGEYPQVPLLFVSPMKRCRQTAKILYPKMDQILVEALRECDFGRFENRSAKEMEKDASYQQWIDSNGSLPFPEGESLENFQKRVLGGMDEVIQVCCKQNVQEAAVVCHGGTIMSLMAALGKPKSDYFTYMVENGGGYALHMGGRSGSAAGSSAGRPEMLVSSSAGDRMVDRKGEQNYQALLT